LTEQQQREQKDQTIFLAARIITDCFGRIEDSIKKIETRLDSLEAENLKVQKSFRGKYDIL
jgi:hypothetical protein